jgi:hypothetical protein
MVGIGHTRRGEMTLSLVALLLGPTLLVVTLLLVTRVANRNWRFTLSDMMMVVTLVAVVAGAIASLVRAAK